MFARARRSTLKTTGSSANAKKLVRLQTQSPSRMLEAISHRRSRILCAPRTIHRLKEELLERERFEFARIEIRLRIDELELVAVSKNELGARFGAHADPVDPRWRLLRTVGLDRDLES